MSPISSDAPENPLPRNQYLRNLAIATLLIGFFYLFCVLALGVAVLAWSATAVVGIFGIQYGGAVILGAVVVPLGRVILAFARSLKIGRSQEFRIPLSREEAPRLWSEVEELARVMKVAPPHQITLENGVSAWVELRGVAAGLGRTRLGVGLDLLVGLTPAEGRAVLAHEIAHSKHVKRGYQGFLMRGLWRLNRCRATLEAITNYPQNASGVRFLARNANRVPELLAERAGRLIAACSRFDEFQADREAALLCGSDAARSALLRTHVLAERAARLSYRERLLHVGRGDVGWLEAQLHIRDDERRQSIENQAIGHARRDEFSTHPALPDRLSALQHLPAALEPFAPDASSTTFWLSQPKDVAIRLLEEVERLAAKHERDETRALAQRMKKQAREQKSVTHVKAGKRPIDGIFGVLIGILFAAATIVSWNSTRSTDLGVMFFLGMLSAGFFAFGAWTLWPRPPRHELQVFNYGDYREAIEARATRRTEQAIRFDAGRNYDETEKRRAQVGEELRQEEERVLISSELRSGLEMENQTPDARMRFWNERGFDVLSQADFERAALCARLSLEAQRKNNPNAWLLHGLGLAFQGQKGVKESIETALKHDDGWSGQWARGLWFFLAGYWGNGEALFLELCRQRPKEATLVALLAGCQSANGKAREALATRRRALELFLSTSLSSHRDEVWYRFDIARSCVALGQTKAAREELSWIEGSECSVGCWNLELEWLRVFVAEGNLNEVGERISRLEKLRNDPAAFLRIAAILAGDRAPFCQGKAESLYDRLLQVGFYPQAQMGLGHLYVERDERASARQKMLEALDCLRERPFDAVHPLSLLGDVLNGLRALNQEKPFKVEGYEIQLDASEWDIDVNKIILLCFHKNEEEAREAADELFAAIAPGQQMEGLISVERVAEGVAPNEMVMPGIMDFKTE